MNGQKDEGRGIHHRDTEGTEKGEQGDFSNRRGFQQEGTEVPEICFPVSDGFPPRSPGGKAKC